MRVATGAIDVAGGGSAVVATDELFTAAAALRQVQSSAEECLALLPRAGWDREVVCSWMRIEAEEYLIRARDALNCAAERADRLVAGLFAAAENYGRTERALGDCAESFGAAMGWTAGRAWPVTLIATAGILVSSAVAVAGGLVVATLITRDPKGVIAAASEWAADKRSLMSHPLFVEAVRTAVSSIDNAMLGAAGLPRFTATMLDDRALGWFGLQSAASVAIVASGPRLLAEGAVVTSLSGRSRATAPGGFADLVKRVPGGAGEPQLRIEKYSSKGETAWIVYVGGTLDGTLSAGAEPWDNTSNLHAIAGAVPDSDSSGAGSVRATLAAMQQAGIRDTDPVMMVGYSQGGIVATRVIQESAVSGAALVTFGAPTGQLVVPSEVVHVAVEHREDLIPALGGHPLSQGQGGLGRIVVRRSVFDGVAPKGNDPLPAHAIRAYRDTAEFMDSSVDPRVRDARARLQQLTQQRRAEVTLWHAERLGATPATSEWSQDQT